MILKLTSTSIWPARLIFLIIIVIICMLLTVGLDLWESRFHNYSFYLSESLLFSYFWWLFIPLLYRQFFIVKEPKTKASIFFNVLLPIVIHMVTYPFVVWLISRLFYYHTFSYFQTFTFELTQYSFILCVVYTAPYVVYASLKGKRSSKNETIVPETQDHFVTNMLISDGSLKTSISIGEILYISSNPPYINIHHQVKRYIHKQTLKSVSEELDSRVFVRVHKSTIVNIKMVHSYRSRQNGDYDLYLHDGTELRLSRNYAADFRSKFSKTPQETP